MESKSGNSILVINNHGIYRLFCPFKAICIKQVECFKVGEELIVIAVKTSLNCKLVYVIQDKAYYHSYFIIASTAG